MVKKSKASRKTRTLQNNNFFLLLLLVVLVLGAYIVYNNQLGLEAPRSTPSPKMLNVTLTEENKSRESGTATLTEENGKVTVTLNLTGAPKNVAQPAHIHAGSCPKVGVVKYPLTFPTNGTSTTTLNTTLDQLKSQLPLAINVHKSKAQSNSFVACGNLSF